MATYSIDKISYGGNIYNLEGVPIGTVQMYAGTSAPNNWLICDGSEYAIADYPALYAVIGDNFGSASDTNHFLVPDFSGRMPLGVGTGTASDATAHTLNQQDGTEGVTLVANQTPLQDHKHNHNIGVSDHAAKNTSNALQTHNHAPNTAGENFLCVDTTVSNASFTVSTTGNNRYTVGYSGTGHFHARTATDTENRSHAHEVGKYTHTVTGNIGGITSHATTINAHNNMPPYLGINFIIYAGA